MFKCLPPDTARCPRTTIVRNTEYNINRVCLSGIRNAGYPRKPPRAAYPTAVPRRADLLTYHKTRWLPENSVYRTRLAGGNGKSEDCQARS